MKQALNLHTSWWLDIILADAMQSDRCEMHGTSSYCSVQCLTRASGLPWTSRTDPALELLTRKKACAEHLRLACRT